VGGPPEVRTLIHELNNALTTVLGHAEWVLGEDADPSVFRRELEAIRRSAYHAANLARELREWVRMSGLAGPAGPAEMLPFRPPPPLHIVEPPRIAVSSRRILVVDDQEEVRTSVGDMLTALGHEVMTAATGREALEYLAQWPADLVFTDFSMPDMDGAAVAAETGRLYPGLPVVMLTGWGTELALSNEAVRMVIAKPITLGALRDAVSLTAA